MPLHEESEELLFFVNGKKIREKNADPETMLLSYLRRNLGLTGTKSGCGGGGCGACTVMISKYDVIQKKILHFSANACLVPICMLHGAAVITVEGIGNSHTRIHPVQEQIAKAHGSQCGFCTPGMVMSMYTLLRNHPEPSMDQLQEALAGNLCRCTGYRPIIDGCKTFCKESACCQNGREGICCLDEDNSCSSSSPDAVKDICTSLFKADELLPLDPTQELIFPPELMLMAEKEEKKRNIVFRGERITWIFPVNLEKLLKLKASYPKAPLVMGNTNIGPDMKFKGVFHPVILCPARILEMNVVYYTEYGITFGAACSLDLVKNTLTKAVSELSKEKIEVFCALLRQLKSLGGQQIRNVASLGGNIMSANPTSDLNPILAAANCTLNLASAEAGTREIALNEDFFVGFGKTAAKPDEVLVSVHIPYSSKWEYMFAFRQAQRRENAFSIVNSGMRVLFHEETAAIEDLRIFYGGMGPTTVSVKKTCKELIGRPWNEEMLSEACRLLLDELPLPGSAPGGMVEYRRALTLSFFFKFYLSVLHRLKEMNITGQDMPLGYFTAIEDFQNETPQSLQIYQEVTQGQPSWDPVGRPIIHQSAIKQATGEAVYCDDIPSLDGELFMALVTSSRPHAKIVSIDVADALNLPGVVDVITASGVLANKITVFPLEGEHLLAEAEVTCIGQIVCAVVADTRVHAKRAAGAMKIAYEDLEPTVFTIEASIQQNSLYKIDMKLAKGNVDEAFEIVDQILEDEIHIGGQEHFYLETNSVLVIPKGEDGEMDVFIATQFPSFTQELVAMTLGVPSNRITCHVKRLGGAFGGKISKAAIIASIAATAAEKTGRSVRCVLERGEDMLITGGRHPFLGKYKVGFMNDGRILAVDVSFYCNAGSALDESALVIEKSVLQFDNAYSIPNIRAQGYACKTNLPSNTAFRGFGFPQGSLVTENWITDVAAKVGFSSEKVREINMYKGVERTHYKQEFDAHSLWRCWNECLEKSAYHNRKIAIEEFNKQHRWKKRGIAVVPIKYGIGFPSSFLNQAAALVHIYKDGSVLVTHGGVEMGQGIHTKMMQVTSRELRIPMSYIHISETSTNTVPNASPSAASYGTDANGLAVKIKKAYFQRISLSATGYSRGLDTKMDWEKQEGQPYGYFTFGACCSVVEIDCLTGDHKSIRTDIVMDVGCSINPAVDIGQIEGSFTQGLGLYTIEELKYSPKGMLYSRGPAQYKIPTVNDVPAQFNVSLLAGSCNPKAIYSSKGIGEPCVFLGCTVFYAIKDAIAAARRDSGLTGPFPLDSPATPERIRMACVDQFTKLVPVDEPGTYGPWAIHI
ncbi:aldehyde oxidase isoform X3 [Latimeria chalumnae]|uniref:aldehyde oxidase isoform X3 n=1 Tax=Latimeria chalumnae TaxID=7897 RepID=UPI00313C5064